MCVLLIGVAILAFFYTLPSLFNLFPLPSKELAGFMRYFFYFFRCVLIHIFLVHVFFFLFPNAIPYLSLTCILLPIIRSTVSSSWRILHAYFIRGSFLRGVLSILSILFRQYISTVEEPTLSFYPLLFLLCSFLYSFFLASWLVVVCGIMPPLFSWLRRMNECLLKLEKLA